MSYLPPYWIENLSRLGFVVSQTGSWKEDHDIIRPFQTIGYAFSYPHQPKDLWLYIHTLSKDSEIGSINLEPIWA